MKIPYRFLEKIKLNQSVKPPTLSQLADANAALIWLPEKADRPHFDALPESELLASRWQQRQPGPVETELANSKGTRVRLTETRESAAFERLTLARKQMKALLNDNTGHLLIDVSCLPEADRATVAEASLISALALACPMPSLKSAKSRDSILRQVRITGLKQKLNLEAIRAEAQGNHLTRWLAALPGNSLNPKLYRGLIEPIAREEGWKLEFLTEAALKKKGAGAFLAVTQGSPHREAGILHLSYKPKGNTKKSALALVGKGICFDTGGVNLKTARYMHGMHEDMTGSAVALGTLLALTRQGYKQPVDCWLALAENHIGPDAYKPNDVVTAANGKTIEIVHTDAEGRMVLADTLFIAGEKKPAVIIDYATLTGACVYSLSSRYSGVFTNNEKLHDRLIAAGKSSGERVWPFPMDADFDDALKSETADLLQCTTDSEADHILAARFLQNFVPEKCDWIHIDLSAHNVKGGLAHISSNITGFGVRFTLHFLLQNP